MRAGGEAMAFEFVCEHLIPGCTSKVEGDTKEKVAEKAARHIHDHHDDMSQRDLRVEIDMAILRQGH
jgi:predicted small metal-binding protein